MLTPDQDFAVEAEHGIIRCSPKNPGAKNAFKVLQITVTRAIEQMPEAPPVTVEIDGIIGPTVTLAVQVIAQRLASGKHQGLAQLGGLQPEDAVPTVAAHAMEIAGYLDGVMHEDPRALIEPELPPPPDPLAGLKELFTPKRIAAAAGTLLGLGALVCFGYAADRRALGQIDRSSWLPPSDGSDEFDDDGHDDGDEDEGPLSDIDTEHAIDAEATEIASHAA